MPQKLMTKRNPLPSVQQCECKRCVERDGPLKAKVAGVPYRWFPKSTERPTSCPNCRSPYWYKDRVRAVRVFRKKSARSGRIAAEA